MPLQFTVAKGDTVGNISTTGLANQLNGAGYQVQGVSPDGATMHMADDHGPYDLKTNDAIDKLGWKVSKVAPQNANYDNVDPGMRAMVTALPEHLRQTVLEGELRNRGIKDPVVVGAGRDWYAYHPETNQYIALTNDPNSWGKADLAEGALEGARGITAGLGGAAGAALGGGTPASAAFAAGGAGLAGGFMDAMERGALSAYSPAYHQVVEEHPSDTAWDMAGRAGMDAAAGGIATAAPGVIRGLAGGAKGIPGMLGRAATGLAEQGPLSRAAQGAGAAADLGGGLTKDAANFLRRPNIAEAVNMGDPFNAVWSGLPVSGDLGNLGIMMQAGEFVPAGIAKGLGSGGEALTKRGFTGAGGKLTDIAKALTENRTALPGFAETPENIYGNAAERIAGGLHGMLGLSGHNAERRAMLNAYREARTMGYGIRPAEAKAVGLGAVGDMQANRANFASRAGQVGEKLGRGASTMADYGRKVQSAGQGLYDVGMGAVEGAGGATQLGGQALEGLGDFAAPIENQMYLQHLGEENQRRRWNDSNPRLDRAPPAKMNPYTFAANR